MYLSDCSCAPILQFFDAALDGATASRQIPDRIFGQIFFISLRKDSVANNDLDVVFLPVVREFGVLYSLQRYKRFVVPSVGGATRFANMRRKFSKMQKIGSRSSCAKYFV